MSPSSNNEEDEIEKAAAHLQDEKETKTNSSNVGDYNGEEKKGEIVVPSKVKTEKSKLLDCCKYYNKLLSTTPPMRSSDRDVLITMLQNKLKSMENLYKKALDEQEDIKRKYAETIQKLNKAEVPQMELIGNKRAEVLAEYIHLDNLRMEILNRLEATKMKPKKCCRQLYEVLGIEIPEKKFNKKAAKPEKKNLEAFEASKKKYASPKKESTEECKQICSDLRREEEIENEDKNPKTQECREICDDLGKKSPVQFEATQNYSLQKELSTQNAEMEMQEKDISDLQDKLKKLRQSLEYLEYFRTPTNKTQFLIAEPPIRFGKIIAPDIRGWQIKGEASGRKENGLPQKVGVDFASYRKSVEDSKFVKRTSEKGSDLKSDESTEKLETKPDEKEFKRRSSRCCKRTPKVKPQQKGLDAPIHKDLNPEDQKCCNLNNCTTSKATVQSKTPAEQTKSTALAFSPSEESKDLEGENLPCYDKCIGENTKSGKVASQGKEAEQSKRPSKQVKSTSIDDEDLKHSDSGKNKTLCCPRRKSKPRGNLDDKYEEKCDCGNCPVENESAIPRNFPSKEKRSKSQGSARREESTCCNFDECPSNNQFHWSVAKSQEITCYDLEVCTKVSKYDAYTLTCYEECPKSKTKIRDKSKESTSDSPKKTKTKEDAKRKELKDAYQKSLKANRDLEMQIQSQKATITEKDDTIEDLQNQLKETLVKNKILLCKFGCQLDELRIGYENTQREMSRLKGSGEALTQNVEELKAEYELALQKKEDEANELRSKLQQAALDSDKTKESKTSKESGKNEQEKETLKPQRNADSDWRALKICESKYNELKSEYDYLKEKLAVSENQCVLLWQEICDLKDDLAKINQENKELQSCKLECDAIKDQCFREYNELKEESKKKAVALEDVQQEKDDLERQNGEQISGLENRILNLSTEGLAMQEVNAKLSQELAEAKDDLENLRTSMDQLTRDKSDLTDELTEKRKEIRWLEDTLEKKSQDLEEATDEKVKAENLHKIQICDLECCIEDQKCRYEDALNELQSEKNANNRLNKNLEKLEAQNATLNGDMEMLKHKYENDVENLRKHLEETQEELQRAEEKLKENEEQLKITVCENECKFFELMNKYNVSQQELQGYQENQEELEGKLAASLKQLEKIKFEVSECMNECQKERGEKERLRRTLDQSSNDFHQKQKSLEETLEALERAKQDKIDIENELKTTICSYECKLNELEAAQESTASELLSLKDEMSRISEENQKLEAQVAEKNGDLVDMQDTIACLKKELEDLKAAPKADRNNGKPEHFVNPMEKKRENEVESGNETKAKCIPECKKRCAAKTELKIQKAKKEECRKSCNILKHSGGSQDQIKRSQAISEKTVQNRPPNNECKDICAELNSIKKMLSDIEIVSTPKPAKETDASESQLMSPSKVNGQKNMRKSNSWKEEYEKTVLERDALKQEISEMYNKLKEVMTELENKLNV